MTVHHHKFSYKKVLATDIILVHTIDNDQIVVSGYSKMNEYQHSLPKE